MVSPGTATERKSRKFMKSSERKLKFQSTSPETYSTMYYISEGISVILNFFTIVVVLQTFFLVRAGCEISKKIRKWIFYYPDRISQSEVFVDYYTRAMNYLEDRKQRSIDTTTDTQLPNDVELINPEEEIAALQEDNSSKNDLDDSDQKESDSAEGFDKPITTPSVVIAEVHTHDTPTSEDDSPKSIRFRGCEDKDADVSDKTRRSLVTEMEKSETEDEKSTEGSEVSPT